MTEPERDRRVAAAWQSEMDLAYDSLRSGNLDASFARFERAHILGQQFTGRHVKAHWGMLQIGVKRGDAREIVGQVTRIIAATLFSRLWVPVGNTGGANVSAFKPMPIPKDLADVLAGTDLPNARSE